MPAGNEKQAKTATKKSIVFTFIAPEAGTANVLGDFNGWDCDRGLMKRNQKGVWKKTLFVKPGTYQYKFYIDGRWTNDPACSETVMNVHGTCNNVIRVAE